VCDRAEDLARIGRKLADNGLYDTLATSTLFSFRATRAVEQLLTCHHLFHLIDVRRLLAWFIATRQAPCSTCAEKQLCFDDMRQLRLKIASMQPNKSSPLIPLTDVDKSKRTLISIVGSHLFSSASMHNNKKESVDLSIDQEMKVVVCEQGNY
jgi:hypothetical protein